MKKVILKSLKLYKFFISPLAYKIIGHGCRFNPTCSEYAYQAISEYGLTKGAGLTLKRILSCHPLSKKPSFDPLPRELSH